MNLNITSNSNGKTLMINNPNREDRFHHLCQVGVSNVLGWVKRLRVKRVTGEKHVNPNTTCLLNVLNGLTRLLPGPVYYPNPFRSYPNSFNQPLIVSVNLVALNFDRPSRDH